MCGLVLVFGKGPTVNKSVWTALQKMMHRGTQTPIVSHFSNCSVGHVRLPIINIHYGQQPFTSDRGDTWLVGEIFNYKELNLDAQTDTQVLQDLVSYNLDPLHKADGMWAGVHRSSTGQTIAFSDYLSQKPLYYSKKYKMIASEPDAFLIFDLTPDLTHLANCIKWGYDPTGGTAWNEVKQLPAGHCIGEKMIPTPYWDWSKISVPNDLAAAFKRAVKNRLVSDQPIAMLLSGGLDSTLVFKVAQDLGADLKVFHVENDEKEMFLEAVGDHPYEELVTEYPKETEAVLAMQSPADAGSLLPQYALGAAVKEKGYHVTLSGDGADELFGGYRRAKDYDSQYSDVFVELPFWHFPRLDRVMMKHTIEHRSPFLAPEIVKYALSLPWIQRTEKQELKRIAQGIVPQAIIDQPKKPLKSIGFDQQHRINLSNTWRYIHDYWRV